MKEFFDALLTRVKSPILGSFCLLYVIWHIKDIGIFLFSSDKVKLEMLANLDIFNGTSLVILLVAVLYVVVLEWIQLLIDKLVSVAREKRQSIVYSQNQKNAANRYRSTDEYQRDLISRELDSWDTERKELEAKVAEVELKFSTNMNKFEMTNEHVREIHKRQSIIDNVIVSQQRTSDSISMIYQDLGLRKLNSDGTEYIGTLDSIRKEITVDHVMELKALIDQLLLVNISHEELKNLSKRIADVESFNETTSTT